MGGDRPERIRQMMLSIRQHNLGWDIRCWHEGNVKDLGLDVNALKDRCVNWASVSNVVRLHAVNQFGGIWCDSDILALKPFNKLRAYKAFAAKQDCLRLCNAFFGAEPGHQWLEWQIARHERLMDADAAAGVYLMTDAPRNGVELIPTHWCYPYSYDTPAENRVPHRDSLAEHKWDGSWTKK